MILQAKEIYKSYKGTSVLQGVSLSVRRGEIHSITGASGEGKTTLLHIIGLLDKADSGEVQILGRAPLNPADMRLNHIGFIFQSYNLLEDISLIENLLIPIRIARKSVKDYLPRAHQLLQEMQLDAKASLPAKVLSGGEKQRAAIARALIHDPELILADEPTGNLDHQNSKIVHKLLIGLKERGKGVVIATHDEELARLTDYEHHLKEGVVIKSSLCNNR